MAQQGKRDTETAESNKWFFDSINFGGPLFFTFEGHETKKMTIGSSYVNSIRKALNIRSDVQGRNNVGMAQRLIQTEKDLQHFLRVASTSIAKGIPCLVIVFTPDKSQIEETER